MAILNFETLRKECWNSCLENFKYVCILRETPKNATETLIEDVNHLWYDTIKVRIWDWKESAQNGKLSMHEMKWP